MKLLLTSNGLANKSIASAFLDLVGKEAKDTKVVFIPTAGLIEPDDKAWLIDDLYRIKQLGCYVDIVDIAQLKKDEWLPRVEPCDVIFIGGGNSFYLSYWLQQSGLLDMLPKLLETRVYAGISAGSMAVCDNIYISSEVIEKVGEMKDDEYDEVGPSGRSSSKTAKLVPFVVRPHLNSPYFPKITEPLLREVAKKLSVPMYALDDQSALKVVDGNVEVISEGDWLLLEPQNT